MNARAATADLIAQLIHARRLKGMSQFETEGLAGVTRYRLTFWETHHQTPAVPSLIAWAHVLGFELRLVCAGEADALSRIRELHNRSLGGICVECASPVPCPTYRLADLRCSTPQQTESEQN